jgi:beta-glucosidase/6-phospho-beta-glucosidase/beta-galactosidase
MGWELYPEAIYHVLMDLRKYDVPVYVTENGLADAKDAQREWFIKETLCFVHRAIKKGADIRGYLHWSLMDNFEWADGFWPRFGLIEIDYATKERKPRPSAYAYKKICEDNGIKF